MNITDLDYVALSGADIEEYELVWEDGEETATMTLDDGFTVSLTSDQAEKLYNAIITFPQEALYMMSNNGFTVMHHTSHILFGEGDCSYDTQWEYIWKVNSGDESYQVDYLNNSTGECDVTDFATFTELKSFYNKNLITQYTP